MQQDLKRQIKTNIAQIEAMKRSAPQLDPAVKRVLNNGVLASKLATAHPAEVPMTPIMHNMLVAFGDIDDDGRLLTGAPVTRAERWLNETVKQLLLKQSKTVHDHYNVSLPLTSVDHYYTDCWLNFDPEKWRDIVPGQVDEINEMIKSYSGPTNGKIPSLDDPVFLKAIEVVLDQLPRVSATRKIVEINIPFMTKHTNVGAPWWKNDRTQVPGKDMTYAQLSMKIAEEHKDDIDFLFKNNVSTEFARYQRGKGRLLIAVSRLVNLVLNQLESVEIQNYKAHSPLFAGYNNSEVLRAVLTEMTRTAERLGHGMYNIDYHRYDKHVLAQWIKLWGAMSMIKCADARSIKLACARAALMLGTTLTAGTIEQVIEIYGRIFSGFIDTNRAGGGINATNMTYLIMKQDPHYVRDIVAAYRYSMLVMGDDNLLITPAGFNLSRLQKEADSLCGFEIDDATKIAFGPKFLQYRLFVDNEGHEVMIYPWTRVLRSMLFKERPAGLGPNGWTLAFYQQLAKLTESPEFLKPVLNIVAAFDRHHLMLDRSIQDVIQGSKDEDRERAQQAKTDAQRRRLHTTNDVLYDGDPSKAAQFDDAGNLEPNYFAKVQQILKDNYDPSYLMNNGIHVPKL